MSFQKTMRMSYVQRLLRFRVYRWGMRHQWLKQREAKGGTEPSKKQMQRIRPAISREFRVAFASHFECPSIARTNFGYAALGVVMLGLTMGCTLAPPPNWDQGGAPLALGTARWDRDGDIFEIEPNGTVTEDGEVIFQIDRAGRVYYEDGNPIAILLPNGHLVGEEAKGMGEVGPVSAAFPGSAFAWLSLDPSGRVIRYDRDGGQYVDGTWTGCNGPMVKTCTLVTHMVAMREWRERPRMRVGVGVGVMVPLN